MNHKIASISMAICYLGWFSQSPSHAQELRVQQPIVQQFSAGTTVSVPDRGRALLGGVNSGATRSKRVGPFRRGSSYGQEFRSSTSSVGVYIHDFESMDQFLLNSAPSAARYSSRNHYLDQMYYKKPQSSQQTKVRDRAHTFNSLELRELKAKRFFELGQSAEKKHATSTVAKLHYRMAAKYGSQKAKSRLRVLNSLKEKENRK